MQGQGVHAVRYYLALFLNGGDSFVSGAKGGEVRIWSVNGSGAKDETVHKELIGLSGAHSSK